MVIGVSNYDEESVSDFIWITDVCLECAKQISKKLNVHGDQMYYFKAVEKSHKLYEFKGW